MEIEFGITFLQKGVRKNYALDSASRNNPNNEFYLLNFGDTSYTINKKPEDILNLLNYLDLSGYPKEQKEA